MAKSYSFVCKAINIKYSAYTFIKQNKALIFIALFCIVLGLLTGIFVAIKCGITTSTISDFNLKIYTCESYADFGAFIARVFSYFCVMLILFVCSINVLLVPVGFVMLGYRSYLLGFNTTLMILLFGITGTLTSVLIILPFGIISMLTLGTYFVLSVNNFVEKKKHGTTCYSNLKLFLIFLLILILLAFLESFLLVLFNAQNILVI